MTQTRPKAYSYIRMSTEVQLRGDSKRRQEELSRAYAEEHGLDLVEGAELHDIGVSAFKGANIKGDGALGRFMDAVKSGRIEQGSYLLVESLDRLSRQEIIKSLALFVEILSGGIKLVTLADGLVYEGDADFQQVLFSLVIMSRAYEESQMKSRRVGASWEEKRKQAGKKIVTRRVPAWLQVNKKGDSITLIKGRADVVARIFEMCTQGLGDFAIAKALTADGVATFGNSKAWNAGSVGKILRNRAVVGEYQLKKMRDGKWVEAGDPILGYFPEVIERSIFDQVQAIRAERRNKGGGRKGEKVSNLFSGIAQCGECDSKMLYLNKGSVAYLTCANARSGGTCQSKSWRYVDFEQSFLSFVTGLDYSSLEGGTIGPDQGQKLRMELAAHKGALEQLEANREKTYQLAMESGQTEFLAVKLAELEEQIEQKQAAMASLEASLSFNAPSTSYAKLKELAASLRGNDAGYELRAHAAALIKEQVSGLYLWRRGSGFAVEDVIDQHGAKLDDDVIQSMRDHAKAEAHFGVTFKLSSTVMQVIYPDPKDPANLLHQIKQDRSSELFIN